MTVLVRMSEGAYAGYVRHAIPDYARDKVASGQWVEADALALARADHAELLPLGLATPDNYLYEIRRAADAPTIGMLWFAVQERAGHKVAYVYDVFVEAPHRQQGHASRTFAALEGIASSLGLAGVALHVFGHNRPAHDLYVRLGYRATNISMFKALGR